jgi:hypothetical protein
MEEYKSVIMIVPYVGTVTNGNTLLQPLGKEEVDFIGYDLCRKFQIEEKHESYIDCMKSLKEQLELILKPFLLTEDVNADQKDQQKNE